MTVESDTSFYENPGPEDGTDALWEVTGRALNFRFIRNTLRRRYRALVALALAGLVVGVGYHLVVPIKYTATATLYLAHSPGSNNTAVAQNDLAMLDTAEVGDRALAILGMKGVTATKFLGKDPGTSPSDNVLVVSMMASSPESAERSANAVATAYLQFRAQQYRDQGDAVVSGAETEVAALKSKIRELSAEIAGSTGATSTQTSTLVAERATATAEITTLRQSIQQGNLDTLSVIRGSRVITPGTVAHVSKKKIFVLAGLAGLAAGLGLGIFLVVAQASLSDRVRRREDLAALLGAPVVVSVDHVKRRHFGIMRRSVRNLARRGDRQIAILGQYFRDLAQASGGEPVMIVAADDPLVPAAAVVVAAPKLTHGERRVVIVDATENRVVSRDLGIRRPSQSPGALHTQRGVLVIRSALPWEDTHDTVSEAELNAIRRADAVFVLATFRAATGAWHLRDWAAHAVVTVTSGSSTAERVATSANLLDAAGIEVRSAVLLDSDPSDDSAGLPLPGAPAPGLRLGVVRTATSAVS